MNVTIMGILTVMGIPIMVTVLVLRVVVVVVVVVLVLVIVVVVVVLVVMVAAAAVVVVVGGSGRGDGQPASLQEAKTPTYRRKCVINNGVPSFLLSHSKQSYVFSRQLDVGSTGNQR